MGRRPKRETPHDDLIIAALHVAMQKIDPEPPSCAKLAEEASSATCPVNAMAVSRFITRQGIDKDKFDDLWRKGKLRAWLINREDGPSHHAELDERD
jgi:hypothetical protein